MTQLAAIDHPAGLDENNLAFTVNYTITDGDGDTATEHAVDQRRRRHADDRRDGRARRTLLLTTQDAQTDGDPTAQDTAVSTANFGGVFGTAGSCVWRGRRRARRCWLCSGPCDGCRVNGWSGFDSNGEHLPARDWRGDHRFDRGGRRDVNVRQHDLLDRGRRHGVVTLTQFAEIDHPIGGDATPTVRRLRTSLRSGQHLVTLTASATITDGDGDTATDSEVVDLGGNIRFADDGPTVTANLLVQLDDDALTGGNAGGIGDDPNASTRPGRWRTAMARTAPARRC